MRRPACYRTGSRTAPTRGDVKRAGLSQTLRQAAGRAVAAPISGFVNLLKSKTVRQQAVLLADRPGAREIKAFTQPQHGFEPPDRSPCRVEGLKAADPRHRSLDPEWSRPPDPTRRMRGVGA